MQANSLKSSILSGLLWQYSQRIGTQLVHFVVSIILARLLSPETFGILALISVFITISNIFIDSGLGNALIQKKELNEKDISSVFFINIGMSCLLYFLIYIAAPFIANFYNLDSLTLLLRIQALQLIIMAFYCVQNALLVRNLQFKHIFIANFSSIIISSTIGIGMAYYGFGVWSLVISHLAMQLCKVVGLWFFSSWRPVLTFSYNSARLMFGYSSKILGGSLLNVCYNNLYNVIIGKKYSVSELSFYNRGQILPTLIIDNAANSINSVIFPALSRLQNDKPQFLNLVRKMVSMIAFIVFPIIAILFPLSHSIVSLLLTDKWLPCVPFMQIVCLTVCFTPFYLINSSILTALGESSKYLYTTIITKVISIILIIFASMINIYMMVAAGCLAAFISLVISASWNKSLIGYRLRDFLSDILPPLLISCPLIACIHVFVNTFNFSNIVTIVISGGIGILFYLLLSYIFRIKHLKLILEYFKLKR